MRSASTAAADVRSGATRTKNLVFGTTLILGLSLTYFYVTDTRSGIHRYLSVPVLRYLYQDAEEAHEVGTHVLGALHRFGVHPRERGPEGGDLRVEVFGQLLDNPMGTSGGIDKNAVIPDPLFALGPAIVEVGGITPRPQEGNPKPRVFRIPSQNAIVNRYGLNSEGAEHVATNLRQRIRRFAQSLGLGVDQEAEDLVLNGGAGVPPGSLVPGKLLAVQVAKNKTTPDSDLDAVRADYVTCVQHLAKYADIIVVNVSSPNTPGLRSLQRAEPLQHLLTGVVDTAKSISRKTKPAVMVKVSPDEDSEAEILGIAQAVWASGVDGVIVGNTTKSRPDPLPAGYTLSAAESEAVAQQGGYSGPQTFTRTLRLVSRYRAILDEALLAHPDMKLTPKVIFASGGITNGKQALQALNAGASVAQVYTALYVPSTSLPLHETQRLTHKDINRVYSGVGTISRIKSEMSDEIRGASAAISASGK